MHERVRAIVATNAFGMGIDKANVRLVVHHTMPGSLEAYYQEAGRAGRNGRRANCVLLHAFQDRFTHEFLIDNPRPRQAMRAGTRARTCDRRIPRARPAGGEPTGRSWTSCSATRTARPAGGASSFDISVIRPPAGQCDGCDNCLGNHREARGG